MSMRGGYWKDGVHYQTIRGPAPFKRGPFVSWNGQRAVIVSCNPMTAIVDLAQPGEPTHRKQVGVEELREVK